VFYFLALPWRERIKLRVVMTPHPALSASDRGIPVDDPLEPAFLSDIIN
jgi:hypothetical protein